MSRLNEKKWTARDDDLLRFHFAARGPWGVADMLGRTAGSVSARAYKLGVTRVRPPRTGSKPRVEGGGIFDASLLPAPPERIPLREQARRARARQLAEALRHATQPEWALRALHILEATITAICEESPEWFERGGGYIGLTAEGREVLRISADCQGPLVPVMPGPARGLTGKIKQPRKSRAVAGGGERGRR